MGDYDQSANHEMPVLLCGREPAGLVEMLRQLGRAVALASLVSRTVPPRRAIAIVDARKDAPSAVATVRWLASLKGDRIAAVLAIAADAPGDRIEELIDAGADHLLVDPVGTRALAAALRLATVRDAAPARDGGDRRGPERRTDAFVTAWRDPLTGAGDTAAIRAWIDARIDDRAPCHVVIVAIARIDLVNAGFGREAGDRLLQLAARLLTPLAHEVGGRSALVARLSGAEFALGIEGQHDEVGLALIAARVAAVLDRVYVVGDDRIAVSTRIVTASATPEDVSASALLDRANAAMAALIGSSATATIRHASGTDRDAEEMVRALAVDIRQALGRDEIEIVFQPQVSIASGLIVGVEALARWDHPRHGPLGAETLFGAAKHSDYLGVLSDHVQRRAVATAAAWPAPLSALRLAINLTAEDVARPGFLGRLLAMVDGEGFPRDRLTLELTETSLVDDLGAASDFLAALRAAGCRVALDDFGTGYSSLAYLKALPLDYLKIDSRLSHDIEGAARDRIVVRGIIDMARALGLSVIAEGVETDRQLHLLAEEGCNYYQGFLCAGPLRSVELTQLLATRASVA